MTSTPTAPFHVGLTPDRVIDAALQLTRESHLLGWSIRDLARRLDVAPSVVYHHVGGKDLIARRIVERVLAKLTPPPSGLTWDEWFRSLLLSGYPIIAAYPGVAKWVLMHGPTFPAIVPIIETGIGILTQEGFGEQAGIAFAALLNNAMLSITIGDDRRIHDDDGPRDHATMMKEFRNTTTGSPAVAALAQGFITPFARGGETAARHRANYFRFIVETTIAGLATLLSPAGDSIMRHPSEN